MCFTNEVATTLQPVPGRAHLVPEINGQVGANRFKEKVKDQIYFRLWEAETVFQLNAESLGAITGFWNKYSVSHRCDST